MPYKPNQPKRTGRKLEPRPGERGHQPASPLHAWLVLPRAGQQPAELQTDHNLRAPAQPCPGSPGAQPMSSASPAPPTALRRSLSLLSRTYSRMVRPMRAGTQNGNSSFMSGECSLDYLICDPYNASLSRSCEFYLHYIFTSNIVDLPAAHVMVLRSQEKKNVTVLPICTLNGRVLSCSIN